MILLQSRLLELVPKCFPSVQQHAFCQHLSSIVSANEIGPVYVFNFTHGLIAIIKQNNKDVFDDNDDDDDNNDDDDDNYGGGGGGE